MIKSVTVTSYTGEVLTMELLNPEKTGFAIKEIEGLNSGKASINTTEMSTVDGSIYNSAHIGERNIVLTLVFLGDNIETLRQETYKYFPLKHKVKLEFETDNRKAWIEGYVESNEAKIWSEIEETQISIICPDPYFHASNYNEVVFSGVEPKFEFPFDKEMTDPTDIEVGRIRILETDNVLYEGDINTGITINIHAIGSVSNIMVYNYYTKENIRINSDKLADLTGSGIVNGDEITICTVNGNKSATLLRNGVETNILNCLNRDCDWFQLAKGDNIFGYTAEEGTYNLYFTITNEVLYEGL